MSEGRVNVGVVGLGYWGPNLARNFDAIEGAELRWCCDTDASVRDRWARDFPGARFASQVEDLLEDDGLDAVAVTTPVPTHAELAARVLAARKHCFVEKPLAQEADVAEELVKLAASVDRMLMVGHLLEYHPGVEGLKSMVDSGELGEIRYVYSQRLNLGKLRADENALWSLGAHDVSVVLALVGELPTAVSAHAKAFVRAGIEDVVFAFLEFASGVVAHLHLSWLDPHKERRITVVGAKRMATFDDMAIERKLTVFDKGFDPDYRSYGEYITRSGAAWSPAVSNAEPLRIECDHFVSAIRESAPPRSDGASGVRVVRVLEALQESLAAQGARVTVTMGGLR